MIGAPSPGATPALTPARLRALAERHGIRPRKSLGQHFLLEPSLARRIVQLAGVASGSRVVEVGPGLGSLTVALAESGASVVAVEIDPKVAEALREVVEGVDGVRVVVGDALEVDWETLLDGDGWVMVANLPYNVAVPVVMRLLETEPRIERLLVMVQREVGERLSARAGDLQYGAVSVRVAYWAEAGIVRRVSRTVFWPRPNVDSVLVRLDRRPAPTSVPREDLWKVLSASFEQRRKAIRSAMLRLGLDRERAERVLAGCGIPPLARPEELALEAFACLAERWRHEVARWAPDG